MKDEHTTAEPKVPVIGRRQRALAGLADQAFNAGSNAVNGLVAGILLGPAAYGRYVAAIGVAFITLAVARSFVGEVMLTHTARARGEDYRGQVRDASGASLGVGVVAAVLGVGIWFAGFELMSDLLWLVPFLPAALLVDAGRYAFLSRRRPQRSMLITGVALLVQLLVVVGLVFADAVRPSTLLAAWGVGMVVGAAVALSLAHVNPFLGHPRRWIAGTGHLSSWFTASAVLSQLQNWVVLYFVGGFLGQADLGGLRMLQMLVLMPVQNFIWALSGMIVPGYSYFASESDAVRIRRRTQTLLLGFTAVGVLLVALVPVAQWLLARLLPAYVEFSGLILPITLQAGLYLAQSPFNAALRGMQRARYSFLQYVVFAGVTLPASLVGALFAGVLGVAYGMAVGAVAGWLAAYLFYRRALSALGRTGSGTGPGGGGGHRTDGTDGTARGGTPPYAGSGRDTAAERNSATERDSTAVQRDSAPEPRPPGGAGRHLNPPTGEHRLDPPARSPRYGAQWDRRVELAAGEHRDQRPPRQRGEPEATSS